MDAPLPPAPARATSNLPEPYYGKYRTATIGQLPKPLRDKLNLMVLDGAPYAQIAKEINDLGANINENNISKWANGGYQVWLSQFNSLQHSRAEQEVAMDLACPDGGSRIHEATLQLAATHITKIVRKLDLSGFEEMLQSDPAKFIPFLNSLATISNAEIKCERHRLEIEEHRAKQHPDPLQHNAPGLTPETRQVIENDLHLM